MTDKDDLVEAIQENTEAIESNATKRRSIVNPLFWIGITAYLLGFLLCITIIGLPIGVGLISSGRKLMYKNKDVVQI